MLLQSGAPKRAPVCQASSQRSVNNHRSLSATDIQPVWPFGLPRGSLRRDIRIENCLTRGNFLLPTIPSAFLGSSTTTGNYPARGLSGQEGLTQQWRRAEPKASYDAVIVGGGGHGLGASYYLAREHGLKNIAVLEKGWIGGGNTGRNTTIIRTNYLFDESAALLRPFAEVVGDPVPGAQLQRYVFAAWRDDACAHRPRSGAGPCRSCARSSSLRPSSGSG